MFLDIGLLYWKLREAERVQFQVIIVHCSIQNLSLPNMVLFNRLHEDGNTLIILFFLNIFSFQISTLVLRTHTPGIVNCKQGILHSFMQTIPYHLNLSKQFVETMHWSLDEIILNLEVRLQAAINHHIHITHTYRIWINKYE